MTDSRALRHRGLIEAAIVPEADIKSTCLRCSGNRGVALEFGNGSEGVSNHIDYAIRRNPNVLQES